MHTRWGRGRRRRGPPVRAALALLVGGAILGLLGLLGLLVLPGGGPGCQGLPVSAGLAGKVILVDPGHGGRDPGAERSGHQEKHIVLAIGLELREALLRAGAVVVMTRESDVDLSQPIPGKRKASDLLARVELARQVLPDVYLSIHANCFPASRWRGGQVFYNTKLGSNLQLAQSIQLELTAFFGVPRQPMVDERQLVLKMLDVPAVCVEVGFMSNAQDLALLLDPAMQRRIARAICRGAGRFLAEATLPQGSGR